MNKNQARNGKAVKDKPKSKPQVRISQVKGPTHKFKQSNSETRRHPGIYWAVCFDSSLRLCLTSVAFASFHDLPQTLKILSVYKKSFRGCLKRRVLRSLLRCVFRPDSRLRCYTAWLRQANSPECEAAKSHPDVKIQYSHSNDRGVAVEGRFQCGHSRVGSLLGVHSFTTVPSMPCFYSSFELTSSVATVMTVTSYATSCSDLLLGVALQSSRHEGADY
ncbi:hypothetical protein Tco_0439198 [Tanacetum coccineum]